MKQTENTFLNILHGCGDLWYIDAIVLKYLAIPGNSSWFVNQLGGVFYAGLIKNGLLILQKRGDIFRS